LQSITFLPYYGGTRCHILFLIRALISLSIADFQLLLDKAFEILRGSFSADARQPYHIVPSIYTLGFHMSPCRRIFGRVFDEEGDVAGAPDSIGTKDPTLIAKADSVVVGTTGGGADADAGSLSAQATR
jgi:hypothetical protein